MRGMKNEANGSAKANKVVSQRNLNTVRHQPVLVVWSQSIWMICLYRNLAAATLLVRLWH